MRSIRCRPEYQAPLHGELQPEHPATDHKQSFFPNWLRRVPGSQAVEILRHQPAESSANYCCGLSERNRNLRNDRSYPRLWRAPRFLWYTSRDLVYFPGKFQWEVQLQLVAGEPPLKRVAWHHIVCELRVVAFHGQFKRWRRLRPERSATG